jgi:hypothetical protein
MNGKPSSPVLRGLGVSNDARPLDMYLGSTVRISPEKSIPIYLVLVIKGVLSGRVELNTQNPTPKGAPFYIASASRQEIKH